MSKLKNKVIGKTIGAGVIGLVSYLYGVKTHTYNIENITLKTKHI